MNVVAYIQEVGLPMDVIYDNKKPDNLPEDVDKDWETVQAYYEQERREEEENGGIPILY